MVWGLIFKTLNTFAFMLIGTISLNVSFFSNVSVSFCSEGDVTLAKAAPGDSFLFFLLSGSAWKDKK